MNLITNFITYQVMTWSALQSSNDITLKADDNTLNSSDPQSEKIRRILDQDRKSIVQLEQSLDTQLDFISLQLAQMQAKLIHIDSIGDKLIKKNEIITATNIVCAAINSYEQ